MSIDEWIDAGGISISAILTVTQTNEVFKTISLILTILATLVVLARNVWEWSRRAKADGKITSDEVKDLVNIIGDSIEDINQTIKGEEEKDETKH